MKAIFPGLPLVDASTKGADGDATNTDSKGAASGFDAVLALVAAQTPGAAQAVKAPAPSVSLQANASGAALDVKPDVQLDAPALPSVPSLSTSLHSAMFPPQLQLTTALDPKPVVSTPASAGAPQLALTQQSVVATSPLLQANLASTARAPAAPTLLPATNSAPNNAPLNAEQPTPPQAQCAPALHAVQSDAAPVTPYLPAQPATIATPAQVVPPEGATVLVPALPTAPAGAVVPQLVSVSAAPLQSDVALPAAPQARSLAQESVPVTATAAQNPPVTQTALTSTPAQTTVVAAAPVQPPQADVESATSAATADSQIAAQAQAALGAPAAHGAPAPAAQTALGAPAAHGAPAPAAQTAPSAQPAQRAAQPALPSAQPTSPALPFARPAPLAAQPASPALMPPVAQSPALSVPQTLPVVQPMLAVPQTLPAAQPALLTAQPMQRAATSSANAAPTQLQQSTASDAFPGRDTALAAVPVVPQPAAQSHDQTPAVLPNASSAPRESKKHEDESAPQAPSKPQQPDAVTSQNSLLLQVAAQLTPAQPLQPTHVKTAAGPTPAAETAGPRAAAPQPPALASDDATTAPTAPGFAAILNPPAIPALESAANTPVAPSANLTAGPALSEPAPGDVQVTAPQTAAPSPVVPTIQLATPDPQTGAQVTHIEFFATGAALAQAGANAPLQTLSEKAGKASNEVEVTASAAETVVGEATHEVAGGKGALRDALAADARSQSSSADNDAAADKKGTGGESPASGQNAQQPIFQATEVQGMRGLEAVVASLLRTGADGSQPSPAQQASMQAITAPVGQVQTEKSVTTKSAEKLTESLESLKGKALQREEERRAAREAPVAETAPQQHHLWLEAKPLEAATPLEPTPDAQPVNQPVVVPDPDAAQMGKLARGESMNAAAISIDHPDLGAMDVVVQNENGRIDVRAVLDTPRAAAVLRAHESALRYGIQQAGMTFGALRVRSRSGETPQIKGREGVKRRRGHEWEA